jgi:hypothetical protein
MNPRPLVIRRSEKELFALRDEYEYRLGFKCKLTPGQLIVYPRWNSSNLTKN